MRTKAKLLRQMPNAKAARAGFSIYESASEPGFGKFVGGALGGLASVVLQDRVAAETVKIGGMTFSKADLAAPFMLHFPKSHDGWNALEEAQKFFREAKERFPLWVVRIQHDQAGVFCVVDPRATNDQERVFWHLYGESR